MAAPKPGSIAVSWATPRFHGKRQLCGRNQEEGAGPEAGLHSLPRPEDEPGETAQEGGAGPLANAHRAGFLGLGSTPLRPYVWTPH